MAHSSHRRGTTCSPPYGPVLSVRRRVTRAPPVPWSVRARCPRACGKPGTSGRWGSSFLFLSPCAAWTLVCGILEHVRVPLHHPSMDLLLDLHTRGCRMGRVPRFPLTHAVCMCAQSGVLFPSCCSSDRLSFLAGCIPLCTHVSRTQKCLWCCRLSLCKADTLTPVWEEFRAFQHGANKARVFRLPGCRGEGHPARGSVRRHPAPRSKVSRCQ
jgi:hypothetical protein